MGHLAFMSRFFTLLAFAALALAVALMVSRPVRARLVATPGAAGMLAWLIAATSMAGSLYYSEIVGFEPCRLCWYQRIAMYPLVVVLGIAAWRRDVGVWRYAVPLSGIGLAISSYHYLLQQFPGLGAAGCSVGVPCTSAWVWELGFVSIPFMAGSGFIAITTLLLVARRGSE